MKSLVLLQVLGAVLMFILAATIGGVVIWGTWDVVLSTFPVLEGKVVKDIELWDAIKLCWIAGALIKSSSTVSSSK